MLDAGLGTASLTDAEKILSNEITIFKDRIRLYAQTSMPGLDFREAWKRRKSVEYQGRIFYIVSLEDLLASKKAAGRDIDLEVVRFLELKAGQGVKTFSQLRIG